LQQKWRVNLGIGHSSPLLVKDKVYVFTRQGEQEVVSCLDFETGKLIWRDGYDAPYTVNPVAARHGKGPKSTPIYDSGRLYTLGISGILSCYDAEKGKALWRREFASEYRSTSPLYGAAMSPVIERGLLIAHVGGNDSGALTAFDALTGKTKWAWNGDGPAYASPIIVDVAGSRQIVTQSQKYIVGISPADGTLLWSIPYTTPYVQNIVTPVLYKRTLIFSGLQNSVIAVRLQNNGGSWKSEKVWENTDASFYMSTPVLSGDILFGMSNKRKGQFVALDAQTGKTLWSAEGRAGDSAAVLAAGGKVFFLTNDASLIVVRAVGTGFEEVRRYTVAPSPTWAHPVFAGKCVLIKDAETLTSWGF
jgi:outer membrane protein assembly factor BamB